MSIERSSKTTKNPVKLSNNTKEEDDQNPACAVYLYKRSIAFTTEKCASLESTDIEAQFTSMAEHWVLLFDWGDHQIYYEATDDEGKLMFSKGDGKPGTVQGMEFTVEKIKDMRVTRQTVDEKAKENRFNGVEYSVTWANCQNWVVELGNLLGIEMPTMQSHKYCKRGLIAGGTLLGSLAVSKMVKSKVENQQKLT